jgi:site-specific DNA-methyltransferase (cytosine-N4-specific)
MLKIAEGSPRQDEHTASVRWMPYRLFPYERRLGLRELEMLGAEVLNREEDGLHLTGDLEKVLARTTYFESVELPATAGGVLTVQAEVEQRHRDLRDEGRRRRQATRFGPHGMHEYKGKFNPQLVRALCNIVDPTAEVLIDPFCGSGTSLVEGLRLNMTVLGVDRSPMAWLMARTKADLVLARDKPAIRARLGEIADAAAAEIEVGQTRCDPADLSLLLGGEATAYLRAWFAEPAFCGLSRGLSSLGAESRSYAGRIAQLALSSLIRQVSDQLPEDLRIRRRAEPFVAPPIAPLFLDAVARFQRGLEEMEGWDPVTTRACVTLDGADSQAPWESVADRGRRLLLTSPPYATALPYIDTDRLSIVALGLARPSRLVELERSLLGSREWNRAEQREWDGRRNGNEAGLPPAVIALLRRIDELNGEAGAGFRRRAVPSLLYRYFAGMAEAMETWHLNLKEGESAVLIVGHNHTTAGGERIDIPTPELLGHLAESRGFEVAELIELETWPRYGLHAANAVAGEDVLVLRVPR